MAEKSSSKGKKGRGLTQEEAVAAFQQLRQEQRALAAKIDELEAEKREHGTVIEALKKVSPDRKCFRMVGGVLVERTVVDVLPALQHNTQQLSALTASLIEQLTKKGKEVNEFREKHNIRLVDEKTGRPVPSQHDSQTPGVLVS